MCSLSLSLSLSECFARRLNKFHVLLDSQLAVDTLVANTPPPGKTWSVFLAVNCGYNRGNGNHNNITKYKPVIVMGKGKYSNKDVNRISHVTKADLKYFHNFAHVTNDNYCSFE